MLECLFDKVQATYLYLTRDSSASAFLLTLRTFSEVF